MTLSSNTLLVSLFLALCSNAVLLLLVLLQLQSGGNGAPDSVGKGCAISIALNGHDSGYSADLPQSSNGRGAFEDRAVMRQTGREKRLRPVRGSYVDSSSDTEHERSNTLRTLRGKHKKESEQRHPHVRTQMHTKKLIPSGTSESPGAMRTDEISHEFHTASFPINSGFSDGGGNLLTAQPLLHNILQDHLLKEFSKSESLGIKMLQTPSDSPSLKRSASNAGYTARDNNLGEHVFTDSKRSSVHTDSNIFNEMFKNKGNVKSRRESGGSIDFSRTKNRNREKVRLQRKKRKAIAKYKEDEEYKFDGSASSLLVMEEIFAAIKKRARKKFTDPVSKILLPALMHFEAMVTRHLDRLNSVMISQDFRLESLETKLLERQHAPGFEPQSDAQDNKTGDETSDIIAEGFIPVGNSSIQLEGDEGSGDVDVHIQPTKATSPMPFDNERYLEIYHGLQTVKNKINALENHNLVVDSELTKTRTEVIKMDDKVTEINRRQKNLGTRTSMQMYRVTELETFMANTEISLQTTLDDFSRMNGRLDVFKDRLKQQSNEMYAMLAQYGRHDQLMEELRSADSYKAHDLNELRNTLMSLEDRLNGLYNVLDQSVDTVRNDVRTMVDGVCTANRLMC